MALCANPWKWPSLVSPVSEALVPTVVVPHVAARPTELAPVLRFQGAFLIAGCRRCDAQNSPSCWKVMASPTQATRRRTHRPTEWWSEYTGPSMTNCERRT
ncbi:hypothetical protein PF005_g33010, partial [Phytophthora fragariae]